MKSLHFTFATGGGGGEIHHLQKWIVCIVSSIGEAALSKKYLATNLPTEKVVSKQFFIFCIEKHVTNGQIVIETRNTLLPIY